MQLWRQLRGPVFVPIVVTIVAPALIVLAWGLRPLDVAPAVGWLLAAVGGAAIATGLVLWTWTVTLFDRIGNGTLAPWDPPGRLVVRGPYRHVRNPMITGVFAILAGEAIAGRSWPLLAWFAIFVTAQAIVVPSWEEPQLARRFGPDYEEYREQVPRWLPRLRAWAPSRTGQRT
jgi:protein-S-isoprenylcysteine O-methyltransferase Ste14